MWQTHQYTLPLELSKIIENKDPKKNELKDLYKEQEEYESKIFKYTKLIYTSLRKVKSELNACNEDVVKNVTGEDIISQLEKLEKLSLQEIPMLIIGLPLLKISASLENE